LFAATEAANQCDKQNEIAAEGGNSSHATLRLVAKKSYDTTYETSAKNCAQVFSLTVRVAEA
jgi:hypothetical protein